ncbi:MAG: haloacid dehalogenase-like hydrolase [Lachnospiraceae bacterium]|nr:haloacid dehalogenase-like hydrolase [Lachnospiraceae bacterium]
MNNKIENQNRSVFITHRIISVMLIMTLIVSVVSFTGCSSDKETSGAKILTYWNDDSTAKKNLINYVETVTNEKSDKFIPVKDRIAVFDFDGTLFCETDPVYFDHMLLIHRVLEDPDYVNQASDYEKEVAAKSKHYAETGEFAEGLDVEHGKALASAFKGMTIDEFNAYIQKFKQTAMPSYEGMNRGGGFYKPMIQVIDYLNANDFTVYVVSGSDRYLVRGIFDGSNINVTNNHIIGSDVTTLASGQGDKDPLSYMFTPEDSVILGGDFIVKNLKMNKVSIIQREIGQKPVLSFGNSSGDYSMDEYTISNNKYQSMAFMLCCDDLERENGNQEKADKMKADCEKYGWTAVSMKNDWTTIYGDGVKKK